MNDTNLVEKIFDDSFIQDFVTAEATETRDSAALITSFAMLLESDQVENLDLDLRRDMAASIKKQCCHILQSSELYAQLFEIFFNPSLSAKVIDIGKFFTKFAESVRNSLEGTCRVEAEFGGEMHTPVNERMLEFVLLLYIRSVVLEGAESIKLSYAAVDEKVVVEVKSGRKFESKKNQYPDYDFYSKYHKELNAVFVEKLGGEMVENKKSMKLTFPKVNIDADGKNESAMHESKMGLPVGVLNPYNIMLSDLSENLI